jgi:hypothetical protein
VSINLTLHEIHVCFWPRSNDMLHSLGGPNPPILLHRLFLFPSVFPPFFLYVNMAEAVAERRLIDAILKDEMVIQFYHFACRKEYERKGRRERRRKGSVSFSHSPFDLWTKSMLFRLRLLQS